ncbi:MAG: NYN domain-containing protein [Vulcanimicrobiaceae bacterium]
MTRSFPTRRPATSIGPLLRPGFRTRMHYRVVTEIVRDCAGSAIEDPRTKQPLTIYRQKGVDVALARAIERSHHTDRWNHLVLAAGDADFAELVEDLVERDAVRATIIGAEKSISLAFRPFVERIIDLQRHAGELALLRSA